MTVTDRSFLDLPEGPVEYVDVPGDDGLAPLVLLHEGLGSVSLWRDFPARLHESTGRRLVVYSRHGYGQSAVVTEPRRVDYMHREATEVLPQVLERLSLDDPVLVGHSDGASIALVHAGTPGLAPVSALMLLAPHVVVEDESIAGIEQARETFLATDLERRMGRHHADPTSTFWGWNDIWLSPEFRTWDITDVLARVDVPVLAMQGHDDQYGTLHQLDLVERGVRGQVSRVHFDDCGHAPHLERPDATLQAMTGFLRSLA